MTQLLSFSDVGTGAAAKLMTIALLASPTATPMTGQALAETFRLFNPSSTGAYGSFRSCSSSSANDAYERNYADLLPLSSGAAVLPQVRSTSEQEKLIGEIRSWALFQANWDGEDALVPLPASLKDAEAFLRLLNADNVAEPILSHAGHAGLFWDKPNLYADLQFLGDSRIAYFIKRNEDRHKGVLTFNGSQMPAVFSNLLTA